MTTPLIDDLNSLATPELTTSLATTLNEPAYRVAGAFTGGVASMLVGVLSRTSDPEAMQSIYRMVTNGTHDDAEFLSAVFGDQQPAVTDALSRHFELHASSVTAILQHAVPLVLGVLAKRVRDDNLNLSTFAETFERERNSIQRVAPIGVATVFGMPEYTPVKTPEVELARQVTEEPTPRLRARRPEPQSTHRRWVLPAVGLAAALALIWGVQSRSRVPAGASYTPPTTGVSGGEVAMPAVGGLHLKNGDVMYVAPKSAEGRLIAFLNDSLGEVKGNTWVVLDHMQFDRKSAKLTESSSEQIKNLAKVLHAYPNAKVRIGGFTDNVGNPGENLRLSQERADAARLAIVHEGISPKRIKARGYGDKQPLASNGTEEGRAQNRRIGLLVTSK